MLPPLPFAYDAALEPATSRSSAKDSTSAKIQGHPSPPTPGTHPHWFTAGTITEAIIDPSREHYVNLEVEALGLMKRE
jgi:hypothetical protein